jgi:peptide/nickel transport system substrate-binding protein
MLAPLAISLLALSPRLPAGTARAADTATLVMAEPGPPASIDPAISYDFTGPATVRILYEGLVHMQGTSTTTIEGVLATSWTSNANKTLWTFHLRHGVLFHDGTPFNAQAVKFSITRNIAVNQAPAYIFGQFMSAKDVEIVDPYTVRFHLHAPAPRLLYALASQYGSYMVSPTAIMKHTVKGDWAQKWLADGHDAGSGAYMLQEYAPNQSATLVKFPQYWRGWSGHHVSKVIVSFVSQDATRRELLERGGADISNTFTPEDMLAMQKNSNLIVDSANIYGNYTMIPTVAGPFASPKARQALAYAFDYNGYINGLIKGFGKLAQGPITRYADGHDPNLPLYHTDLAKAKQLFNEAGVKPGTTVTLWYASDDEMQRDAALVMQGQLAQLGITLNIQPRDASTYFNALFGSEPLSQRPNLWVNGWSGDYNDALAWFLPLYHSKTPDNSAGGANAGLYHNATVDKLLDQVGSMLDMAKRQQLLNQVQEILTVTDPGGIYVGEVTNSTTYRRNLHGYYYNRVDVLSYDVYSFWKS